MLTPLPQRQGVNSREIYYRELDTAPGVDPASPVGYVLHLADEAAFGTSDKLIDAPRFVGNRDPDDVINGNITADGENPYGLEFRTFPRLLKDAFGASGYSRPGGAATTLHRLVPPPAGGIMGSGQLQDESLETPVIYTRNKGVRIGGVNLSYAQEGVGRYGMPFMGVADEVYTDLGGTVIDEGYSAVSYFNGSAKLNGYFLVGMSEFSIALDFGLSRQDAAFRAGLAAAINYGKISAKGKLGLTFNTSGAAPENDLNFYNMAVNQSAVPLEIVWANNPIDLATMWCRIVMPAVRFSRKGFRPGGVMGKVITQDYSAKNGNMAAEKFNTIAAASYTLTTANKLGIKINGGATVPVTLGTASTTVTRSAVIAAIAAVSGFNTLATIEDWHGRMLMRTIGKGSAFSLQIDTAQADSAHAILGFDGVAELGISNKAMKLEFYNDIGVDL